MEYTIRDLQLSIFEVMLELKRVCDENHLRYTLFGGTCLGAIRHGGFIPWDDDADFAMPRSDLNKLLNLYKNGAFKGEYVLQSYDPEKEPHYSEGMMRLRKKNTLCVIDYHRSAGYNELGVFVDIFPLDPIKKSANVRRLWSRYHLVQRCLGNKISAKTPTLKSKLLRFVLRPFSKESLLAKRESICKKINDEDADFCIDLNSKEGLKKGVFDKGIVFDTIDKPFEGVLFKVPNDYDKFLKYVYGDYMKLPPENERVGHLPKEIKL